MPDGIRSSDDDGGDPRLRPPCRSSAQQPTSAIVSAYPQVDIPEAPTPRSLGLSNLTPSEQTVCAGRLQEAKWRVTQALECPDRVAHELSGSV